MVKQFSQVLFSTFSGSRDTMYEKGPCGVFFYMCFSNSLNMKKISSYTFVRLVKLLNDIRFITMMNMSFSFLRLIKLTRLDSSKGWTYSESICYPLQACDKKIMGYLPEMVGGKFRNLSSRVDSLLLKMTLFTSCRVGTSSFALLTFLCLGHSFLPSI